MSDINDLVASARERQRAVQLLLMFRDRMEEKDQTLEMLFYKAAPQYGPLVKRTDIYHWFKGRSGISPSKYPPVKAFIGTKAFQQRVPEAIGFVAGYQALILHVGQVAFLRLGNADVKSSERQSRLRRAAGYFLDVRLADKQLTGLFRVDYVKGHDALVFASYEPVRQRVTTGFMVHQRASSIGLSPLSDSGIEESLDARRNDLRRNPSVVEDVYLVDAIERFTKAPLRRHLWFNAENNLVGKGGELMWGSHWIDIVLVGPVPEPSRDKFNPTTKNCLDQIIWDVAAHEIIKS